MHQVKGISRNLSRGDNFNDVQAPMEGPQSTVEVIPPTNSLGRIINYIFI